MRELPQETKVNVELIDGQYHEYVITLHDRNDLEDFYQDMETPGGSLHIPNRAVNLYKRRPLSRNTHYLLTPAERDLVLEDSRVSDVQLADMLRQIKKPCFDITGNFSKDENTISTDHKNWGHLRSAETSSRSNWGIDGNPDQNDTVTLTSSGKNVDVIIIDGHFDPSHPEFAVNSNGTGGSRANSFNWYSLNSVVASIDDDNRTLPTGSYIYGPYVDVNSTDRTNGNNHGAHVAGTVAGNTYGWAKDANLYNIEFGSLTDPNNMDSLLLYDYIRAFHQTKSVNPQTGIKNPTVCNGSYGSSITYGVGGSFGPITRAIYRGVDTGTTASGLSTTDLANSGITTFGVPGVSIVPFLSVADAADIADMVADGIHFVAAAGNDYHKIVRSTDAQDYNNVFFATYLGTNFTWYTNRGSAPGIIDTVINVGAVGINVDDRKAIFSNCGTGVDVFAPGEGIISATHTAAGSSNQSDVRDTNYYDSKFQGTSMASPQVCGILACALETYPRMSPSDAKQYIIDYANQNQMFDGAFVNADSYTSLQDSPNRIVKYHYERPTQGDVFPKKNYHKRPTSGAAWPRPRLRSGL